MQNDNYAVNFALTFENSWLDIERLYLGNVPKGLGIPDTFGLITKNSQPFLCLYTYRKVSSSIKAVIWKDWAVVLCEEQLYFISLQSKAIQNYALGRGWFDGNFYPQENVLLVTGPSSVLCFNEDVKLLWQTNGLAEEIVIIKKVEDNIISGQGQWEQPNIIDFATYDPSHDLEPFKLDLRTGTRLE